MVTNLTPGRTDYQDEILSGIDFTAVNASFWNFAGAYFINCKFWIDSIFHSANMMKCHFDTASAETLGYGKWHRSTWSDEAFTIMDEEGHTYSGVFAPVGSFTYSQVKTADVEVQRLNCQTTQPHLPGLLDRSYELAAHFGKDYKPIW